MEFFVVIGFLLVLIGLIYSASPRRKSRTVNTASTPQRGSSAPKDIANTLFEKPPSKQEVIDSCDTVVLSSLLPKQFIVLDLETTGLDPLRDEIIEFGAMRISLDSIKYDTFQTLVKPERRVPKKITEITAITQEMVDMQGIELREALIQFIEFIGELPIVTFNAEFDMGFVYSAARKYGLSVNNRYTCALKRARRAWPNLPSYKLSYLAEMAKLSNDETHRALGDCKRAAIIFAAATAILNQKVRWSKPPIG